MTDILKIDWEEYYAKDVAHYEIAVKKDWQWKNILVWTNWDFWNEDYVLWEYEFIEDYLQKLKEENEDAFIISVTYD